MTGRFQKISDGDLREIALAIRSGRLASPYTTVALQRIVSGDVASLASNLQSLSQNGFGAEQVAMTLELLRADRQARPPIEDVLELVTTGPEVPGIANRDTSVVVRELFASARESVLVAGYAVYQGQRVFQALADRMVEVPGLKVRMFLDIQRGHGDTTAAPKLIRRFAARFRSDQWPKDRPLPEVYFDPRSLETDPERRASLHAKCVIVDGKDVFVSSANFTEAAQQRNIEIGLLIRSAEVATRVTQYFNALLSEGRIATVCSDKVSATG
jgi:phosphatidylserine/phosphatidylglycerophosphate/cardiolipin synthase-like enzyme